MAKQLTLFKYTFATPKRRESTSEQQNRSDRQEDAGANSTETGCAAQQIQYELAQQVFIYLDNSPKTLKITIRIMPSVKSTSFHILISMIRPPVPAKQAQKQVMFQQILLPDQNKLQCNQS